jgi:1,4-alpha-glucan branching enzyme
MDSHDSAANGSSRFVSVIAPKDTNSYFARKQSLIAATLQLTLPGIPMLFQGQEFLETGEFNDWQALDWTKTEIKNNQGIIEAYRKLTELRRNYFGHSKGLTGKNCNLLNYDETNKVISYHRWYEGGHGDDVVVIINFGNRDFNEYTLNLPHDGEWQVAFSSAENKYVGESKKFKLSTVQVEHGSSTIKIPQSCSIVLTR